MNEELKNLRLGEINKNKFGTLMKIIEYINSQKITIEFQDDNKYKVKTRYANFKNGAIANPFDKVICGVGYIGEWGKSNTKSYNHWIHMINRCYDTKEYLSYKDCEVCKEWHNFQNFNNWYKENYYEITNEKMCLDKDILVKGNRLYSPETCVFVPEKINLLFVGSKKNRGIYPVGVRKTKNQKKYYASFSKNCKSIFLNTCVNPIEAFYIHKIKREEYIKEIAEQYKQYIPEKLYNTMINYEVEITD